MHSFKLYMYARNKNFVIKYQHFIIIRNKLVITLVLLSVLCFIFYNMDNDVWFIELYYDIIQFYI